MEPGSRSEAEAHSNGSGTGSEEGSPCRALGLPLGETLAGLELDDTDEGIGGVEEVIGGEVVLGEGIVFLYIGLLALEDLRMPAVATRKHAQ